MNLSEASFAVLEELKLMRDEGLREIYLEDETIANLEKKLGPVVSTNPSETLLEPKEKKLDLAPMKEVKSSPQNHIPRKPHDRPWEDFSLIHLIV